MSSLFLSIACIERRLSTGSAESISFEPGVNLLIGPPNTGKTKWLQTLDYLLGDLGDNPFEGEEESGLAEKYESAAAEIHIGEKRFFIERRWRESGSKSKVFVDGEGMPAPVFQRFLMQELGIPLLNFPKGNPMSGQTWPELSFRMLLRHIYRRQSFWSDIADKQLDGEQYACLLQFLGLAESIYSKDYGNLVRLKMEVQQLKARREQYAQTLDDLAQDILSENGQIVSANTTTVKDAGVRISHEIQALLQRRKTLITNAVKQTHSENQSNHVQRLGEEHAKLLILMEENKLKHNTVSKRLQDMRRYSKELADELDRLERAEDAGVILADLKITHCPACDSPIDSYITETDRCFLCHQPLPDDPKIKGLGASRLRFERERLSGELKEAEQLVAVLDKDVKDIERQVSGIDEKIHCIDSQLIPARQAVGALVHSEVSSIDMALGELNERQRQIGRVSSALEIGQGMTKRITEKELEIEPIQSRVDESIRATDFEAAASHLEAGMNSYFSAINRLKPGVWRHNRIDISVSRPPFKIRIGERRWRDVLGGTDTLYFLMAYHYGLLSLSNKLGCKYPGLSIIDVPGEFSGEDIEDKENFIVQPFIDLLSEEDYSGAQLIITGASFTGLNTVNRIQLSRVHLA